MGELFNTPSHPLLVHIPIVLLPLLAVLAIVMAAKPSWRSRLLWPLVVATLVTAAVTFWATQAGEQLQDALQPALGSKGDRHAELGDQTALLATIFFVGAAAMVVIDRWFKRLMRSATALAWAVAVIGVVATVWVIRTGHEGARITWDGVNIGG
ncbi:MAG: hypothetical protein K8R99_09605 [Actinomycetia bacterium]|nr:hypothetical protein [Actinomycetes bacterium]